MPPMVGDEQRLQQAFGQLIDNAICHAGYGGEILVRLRLKRHQIEIAVVDRGIGIPEKLRERVFDQFYQIDQSRTDKKHSGLGLPVAQAIVCQHGGRITLEETNGGGCTFIIIFPF